MALTLQCLSRAACRQQVLAASPRVLGAVTPKTPAISPSVVSAARFSPFSAAAVSFGDLETATPKALDTVTGPTFGDSLWHRTVAGPASPATFLRQAKASAAAQQELARAARPCAEAALQHFLARRSHASAPIKNTSGTPSLFGGHGARTMSAAAANTNTALPTLLGRRTSEPASEPPAVGKPELEFDAFSAARQAREVFFARQQRIGSRGIDNRVP